MLWIYGSRKIKRKKKREKKREKEKRKIKFLKKKGKKKKEKGKGKGAALQFSALTIDQLGSQLRHLDEFHSRAMNKEAACQGTRCPHESSEEGKLHDPSFLFWGVNGSHLCCLRVLITANASFLKLYVESTHLIMSISSGCEKTYFSLPNMPNAILQQWSLLTLPGVPYSKQVPC